MGVIENLKSIKAGIEKAAWRAKRDPQQVKLVAVTKGVEPESLLLAYSAGVRDFGENYLQEAKSKIELAPRDINWHFIGHLQKNKVKAVLALFTLIHSVDSLELLELINRRAREQGRKVPLLLEVNLAGEETKFGLEEKKAINLLKESQHLPFIEIQGLMTMPPYPLNPEENRPYFKALRELKDKLSRLDFPHFKGFHLSMGMSDDFEVAIEEGATLIRLGRAIFGQRREK